MGHFVLGMILVGLGVLGIVTWWTLFGLVMRGVVPFLLLFFGLIAILASIRRVPDETAEAARDLFEPDTSAEVTDEQAELELARALARVR